MDLPHGNYLHNIYIVLDIIGNVAGSYDSKDTGGWL